MIHSNEKGQILVFMALVLMGLLGITALAIDGGMIYADQRYSQSAADAASLAGAGAAATVVDDMDISNPEWNCSILGGSMAAAYSNAISKAASNDYIIAQDTSLGAEGHNHGVKVTCSDSGEYIDVEVMLTRTTDTSFVHLFNGGEMKTTAYSKTRVKPRLLGSGGASIVSLSKDCGNKAGGVWFSGTNDTILRSGGVYSNSCVDRNSGASTVTFQDGATVTYHAGSYSAGISSPEPIADDNFHPLTDNPIPFTIENCQKLPDRGSLSFPTGSEQTIEPGRYTEWDFKIPVHLNPGLYCISGKVSMNAAAYVYGDDITIYFTGTSLTLNGGANTDLRAPQHYTDVNPPPNYAVNRLLLYIPTDVIADVTINGNSNNTLAGTLYMPSSLVKINGTSDSASASNLECSIIGHWVTFTGTSDFNILYNPDMEYSRPASIQVQR